MTVTINGSTGVSSDTGFSCDGVSFADNAPSNSLVVNSSGRVGIGTSAPGINLQVGDTTNDTGTVGIRAATAGTGTPQISLLRLGQEEWYMRNASGSLAFIANSNERMRIDSSGNLLVNRTTQFSDGQYSANFPGITKRGATYNNTDGNSGANFVSFGNNGTVIGTIQQNGASNVTYSTSSDYRLKENIQPMTGALATVSQLNPVTYTWKADGSDGQGFIAHELQAVVPDCVTGEKDAVDADGNPIYQGIDTSFLVATLTKAIQEQQEQIEQMKQEIAALKGAA